MDELLQSIARATSGGFADDYAKEDLLRLLSAAEDALKVGEPPKGANSEARFNSFRAALDDLCRRHGIQIATTGYDGLEAWPLQDGENPVRSAGFENCIPDGPNVRANLETTA